MERKVLGRGLNALIPQTPVDSREKVQTLRTDQIFSSRFQPRLTFSQVKIEELANSIREQGVIQPILVRAVDVDKYELIAGERRLRAVKHLGHTEIPAIIRRVADADVLEMAIIENIQREELNALEEAKAYRRLAQEFGHSNDHIANRVGKDNSTISNLLRLLNLPEKIQEFLSQNMISYGHARALLAFREEGRQMDVCEKIMKQGLSVRQVEQLTTLVRKPSSKPSKKKEKDVYIKSIEDKLQHILGTKVRIQHGIKRGKIEIEYYSLEDLNRVLDILKAS
jgi:ParB family chromosome partitioning protein